MTETTRNIIEKLGWNVSEYNDGSVELSQYTPAGEDFSFTVDKVNLIDDICSYASNFDIDEHIEMLVEARHGGVSGVPSVRELVKDAEELKNMLDELAEAVNPRKTIREIVAESREDKYKFITCLGLFGYFLEERLDEELPDGLYAYEFRSDMDTDFCTLEPHVAINFSGTFITDVEIEFGDKGYKKLTEDTRPNFSPLYIADCVAGERENKRTIAEVAEAFNGGCCMNTTWDDVPLTIEVKGLSTVEMYALAPYLKAVIINFIGSTDVRDVRVGRRLPTENIGRVFWGIDDILSYAKEHNVPIDRDILLRACQIFNRKIQDPAQEQALYTIDNALYEASKYEARIRSIKKPE